MSGYMLRHIYTLHICCVYWHICPHMYTYTWCSLISDIYCHIHVTVYVELYVGYIYTRHVCLHIGQHILAYRFIYVSYDICTYMLHISRIYFFCVWGARCVLQAPKRKGGYNTANPVFDPTTQHRDHL